MGADRGLLNNWIALKSNATRSTALSYHNPLSQRAIGQFNRPAAFGFQSWAGRVTVAIGLGSAGAVEVTDGCEISNSGNERVNSAIRAPKKSESVLRLPRLAEADRLEDWDKLPGCIEAWVKVSKRIVKTGCS